MTKTVSIINLVAIACLVSTIAFAEEKAKKADEGTAKATTIDEVAVVRARAQVIVQELLQLIDGNTSGYSAKANNIYFAYTKIVAMLQRAIQQEQAKPADSQNKVLIEDCVRMQQNIGDRWTKYSTIEKAALDVKILEIYNLFHQGINPVVANLTAVDVPYNRLNLDFGPLKAVYVAVEARGNELKAQANGAIDGLGNLQMKWDEELKTVTKLTGQKID